MKVLWPILILSAALSVAMLTKDHDWGDDFAAYIMQAQSILHGSEREAIARSAFSVQQSSRYYGPAAAPWGFPTFLAPMYLACGGLNIWCLKLVNVPFYSLFLVAFFLFLRPRLPLLDSVLLVSVFAVSPVLLAFHNDVLSDLPFLFFSTLGLLLIDRIIVSPGRPEGSWRGNVGIGVVMFLAFFVRANGVLLVPTLFVAQAALYRSREGARWAHVRPLGVVPYLVCGALIAMAFVAFPRDASEFTHFRTLTLDQVLDNVTAYVTLPAIFFWPLPLYEFCYGALLPFLIAGIALHWRDDRHVAVYAGLTLLLFVLWPEQQGLRYLFPILPFFVYFVYRGMQASACALTERFRKAGDRLTLVVWTAVTLTFAVTSVRQARAAIAQPYMAGGGPFDTVSLEMFDAIRTRTAPTDVVIFDLPRLMRLMTDRNALLIDRCDQLVRGSFVVVRKEGSTSNQLSPRSITACSALVDRAPIFDPIFDNGRYVVYRIHPRPGSGPPPGPTS